MTALAIIDEIDVASPCPANWNEMKGGDRVRFCSDCKKNVYNLSAMTRAEAIALVDELEPDGFCGRFFRRADGTMLTADCPVGLAEQLRRKSRRAFAAGLYLITLLFLAATSFVTGRALQNIGSDAVDHVAKTTDRIFGPPVSELVEPEMGEVEVEPPSSAGMMLKGDIAVPSLGD